MESHIAGQQGRRSQPHSCPAEAEFTCPQQAALGLFCATIVTHSSVRVNPLSPPDALKHHFTSLKTD